MGAVAFGEVWLQSITGPVLLTPYISTAPGLGGKCWPRQGWTGQSGQRNLLLGAALLDPLQHPCPVWMDGAHHSGTTKEGAALSWVPAMMGDPVPSTAPCCSALPVDLTGS